MIFKLIFEHMQSINLKKTQITIKYLLKNNFRGFYVIFVILFKRKLPSP